MSNAPNTGDKMPPGEDRQWQLALAYLKRADDAANILRVLLFVAAIGSIVILFSLIGTGAGRTLFVAHITAIILCAMSITLQVRGWQLQKEKAIERFKYLRGRNYDAYLQYDSAAESIGTRDTRLDWWAFFCLLAAFIIELAARCLASFSGVHV